MILQFAADSIGTVQPEATLTAPANIQISLVSADEKGQIYVGGCTQDSSLCEVAVYAVGSTGSALPLRTITGGSAGPFQNVSAIAVDSAGLLYVQSNASIVVFAADANGNATPLRTIEAVLPAETTVRGFAVDFSGYLYLGDVDSDGCEVAVLAPGASGSATPVRDIPVEPSSPACEVVADANGNIYTASLTYTASTGTYAPQFSEFAGGQSGSPVPSRVITGAETGVGLLGAIGVDATDNFYVASSQSQKYPYNTSISVFSATQNGNVAPERAFLLPALVPASGAQIGIY